MPKSPTSYPLVPNENNSNGARNVSPCIMRKQKVTILIAEFEFKY
ncbi:MAG: hypothetical protein U0Y96_10945 [Candidatus Kapaibacterium sp.]